MIPFNMAPIGARFKKKGSDKIWVLIDNYPYTKGLIVEWHGNISKRQIWSYFIDSDNDFETMIELL